MKDTKNTKGKKLLKKLATNKGFYIALCAVVMVVGFFVYANGVKTSMENDVLSFDESAWQEAVSESGVEVIDVDELAEEEPSQETVKKIAPEDVEKAEEDSVDEEASVETSAESSGTFGLAMPCVGNVVAECSIDELVYCSSMSDWRTHNGMDIAAAEGDPVKAADDGVISKVYEDELLGIVVEIEHEDGIVSRYGNLQSVDFIDAGTKVGRGDIIGGVGKPGALEADAEPHLHFEVMVNGEYRNPVEYIVQ